jgi:hypothetical protein
MIGLGVILIILGLVFKAIKWLFVLGVVLLVMGAVLAILGRIGHPVYGRRHWY